MSVSVRSFSHCSVMKTISRGETKRVAGLGLTVLLLTIASSYAVGVSVSWNASVDNTWENASNWTPALEPTNNLFDVTIGIPAACNLSSGFQIDALTLSNSSSKLNLVGGALLALTNDVTNNGTIVVNTTDPVNSTSTLRFDASAMLTGSGTVRLNGIGYNRANLNGNGNTMTIGANQTVRGRGTIFSILVNDGTIVGDDSAGNNVQLDLNNGANQNNATIKATNGGVVGLYSGTIDQTGGSGGTFLADGANSIVQFGGGSFATLIGGTVTTSNGGTILGVYTGWQGVTNNGTVQIPGGAIIVVTGTGLTNNGTILVNSTDPTNSTSSLRFDASGTLGGNGTIKLDGIGYNRANLNGNNNTMTIGANQTVHGRGTIFSILVNNGTIIGDDSAGNNIQLDLNNGANQNNSTIKATNGGVVGLYSGTIDQTGGSGGTFLADGANSIVQLGGGGVATVVGGILNTANNGIIQVTPGGAGVGLTSVTNNGTVQIPGGEIIVVSGTGLTNNGTILVDTNADNSTTKVRFDADGTLGGNGSVTLNGILGSYNVADFDCNGHAVINGANHTIKGNGDIFMNGGTLTNNGIITPGLSPGRLEYSGTLTLGSTSNLVFEIAGTSQGSTYDWLNKIDNAGQILGGNLVVRLINNFTPASSDIFTILTTQTTLAGAFGNVASGGRLATADGRGSFVVTYSGQKNVVLSQFAVTSPSSKITEISSRDAVTKTNSSITSNFTITGTDATKVIVRGLGPSVHATGTLAQPVLRLLDHNGVTLATNDDWKSTQQAAILATGLAPRNDEESAIVITLSPGSYTAILTGEAQTIGRRTTTSPGAGQIEVYDLSPSANSTLAIMSSLGFAGTEEAVMIADFTIGGGDGNTKVLLRVLGPSLQEVAGTLQDPTLELDNANRTQIFFNDNWQDSQKAAILATGLAPRNPNEPAIVANLGPGHYTAIVRGKVVGTGSRAKVTTGFARVEVYQLQQTSK